MNYILVGIGGAFGALARYFLGQKINAKKKSDFPLGTFVINVTGAILLGVLTAFETNNYLLLGEGFLGAYTTFSTFMYESFDLFRGKKALNAAVYISISLILGILGYLLGFEAVKLLMH